jgi:hypothetical protein
MPLIDRMALESLQVLYKPHAAIVNTQYRYLSNQLKHVLVLTFIGKFYLIDAGYAVRSGFLPPFRGVRYHLREYGANRPQNQRELFNLRHSSLRVTVKRVFGWTTNHFTLIKHK